MEVELILETIKFLRDKLYIFKLSQDKLSRKNKKFAKVSPIKDSFI